MDLESVNEGDGRFGPLLAKSCAQERKPQGEEKKNFTLPLNHHFIFFSLDKRKSRALAQGKGLFTTCGKSF